MHTIQGRIRTFLIGMIVSLLLCAGARANGIIDDPAMRVEQGDFRSPISQGVNFEPGAGGGRLFDYYNPGPGYITELSIDTYLLTGLTLLQISPSKTDTERVIPADPELVAVLARIIRRIKADDGQVPLLARYDTYERVYGPPLPHLFQRICHRQPRMLSPHKVRELLDWLAEQAGITDTDGTRLRFTPHDFRRVFSTETEMSRIASDATFGRAGETPLPAVQRVAFGRARPHGWAVHYA